MIFASGVLKVAGRVTIFLLGLALLFLGIEPLVTPPWGHFIWFWTFPFIPIPYLGNVFWAIWGVAFMFHALFGSLWSD